jgi:hypothetical protein
MRLMGILALSTGVGLLTRGFFESLNIVSYGWLSGDLPFWIIVISLFSLGKIIPSELYNRKKLFGNI